MNRDQALGLMLGLADDDYENKVKAIGVVFDLLEEARDATAKKAPEVAELPRWRIDDRRGWADLPATTEDGPTYADLLHERDTLFRAAREVIQRIDRTGRAAAIAQLAEVIGESNREDT